jgi:hypothetical protein
MYTATFNFKHICNLYVYYLWVPNTVRTKVIIFLAVISQLIFVMEIAVAFLRWERITKCLHFKG